MMHDSDPGSSSGPSFSSSLGGPSPLVRRAVVYAAAVTLAVAPMVYAIRERRAAEGLAERNQQVNTELNATRSQLNDLAGKVNALEARSQEPAAPAQQPPSSLQTAGLQRRSKPHAGRVQDRKLTRMQAQLDAQGREIEATRGDLVSTRTELTGSIAHTHDELVVLEKRGQRNYFEFDLVKSKQYKKEGPVGISLRKSNVKHQYADLQLMVDDRDLTQKHVNLDQPVMYYQPDTEQPIQVVINSITKDHIHGYVSAPKYRKSELASMAGGDANGANAQNESDGIVGDSQTAPRKRLTVPPPQ